MADSLVGVAFMRNLLATIFVFAVTPWLNAVGLPNMFLTFGMILLLVLGPGTIAFLYYGKRVRTWIVARYHHYSSWQTGTRGI